MAKPKEIISTEELINDLPSFETEDEAYLRELEVHFENLMILEERARLSAYGTGKRDPETGFWNRGCGKQCCIGRYEKLKAQRETAEMKYYLEKSRINGNGSDPDEDALANFALQRLKERTDERN